MKTIYRAQSLFALLVSTVFAVESGAVAQQPLGPSTKPAEANAGKTTSEGAEAVRLLPDLANDAAINKLSVLNYPTQGGLSSYLDYSAQRQGGLSVIRATDFATTSLGVIGAGGAVYAAHTACAEDGFVSCGVATAKANASLLSLGGTAFRNIGTGLDLAATTVDAGVNCYSGSGADCASGTLEFAGNAIGLLGAEGRLLSTSYKAGNFVGHLIDGATTAALGEPLGDWVYDRSHSNARSSPDFNAEIDQATDDAIAHASQSGALIRPAEPGGELQFLSRQAAETATASATSTDERSSAFPIAKAPGAVTSAEDDGGINLPSWNQLVQNPSQAATLRSQLQSRLNKPVGTGTMAPPKKTAPSERCVAGDGGPCLTGT